MSSLALSGWALSDPSSLTQMAKVELEGEFSELFVLTELYDVHPQEQPAGI
jgi:hypothetical protein